MSPQPLRLGSMCTGYGGLDLAVEAALGPVKHVWHCEIDPAASKVLAVRWPEVPNLGDIRAVDWSTVEPVDILTAGFPCQPVSVAGKRTGINDERWLFDDITEAIGRMGTRPRLLVLENVPGLLTANRGHAMARVVHGLAALGYVGRYRVLRASDVGAPHRRERVFIVADLADAPRIRLRNSWPAGERGFPGTALTGGVGINGGNHPLNLLLPTPCARDAKGARSRGIDGPDLRTTVALLPTGSSGDLMLPSAVLLLPTPQGSDAQGGPRPVPPVRTHSGPDHGPRLRDVAPLLLTPTATNSHGNQSNDRGEPLLPAVAADSTRFGQFAPAIARWAKVLGRPAPDPTEPAANGKPRLSPAFVEWMMGLPAGWVTDLVLPQRTPCPSRISRNDALRILGNGVVWLQGAVAVVDLLEQADDRRQPATSSY